MINRFKYIDVLIVKNNIKNKIIEELNNNGLFNIKVMSLKEVLNKYYFTYDEKTIYYLVSKYNYNIDVDGIKYSLPIEFIVTVNAILQFS